MSDDEDYKESNINYKSICCEQIPELFLDKLVAKKHFSKFGKINRFILRPKRLSCTVEYETEDAAERAFVDGGRYNGFEFTVNYAEREVGHVQNTEEWVGSSMDPDVQSELEAMNPGQRHAMGSLHMRQSAAPPVPKFTATRVAKSVAVAAPAAQKPIVKVAPPELPKIDAALHNELESILRRPALMDEDKYRVLDARDKLIRLTTVRQTDIKTAVSTKGTCPDMCPEKERLMREFQRQVSSFEMSNDDDIQSSSTISHKRAIKEYSRSSADQEVPLSHELRAESVLQMTMLYLMHCILDLCDDPDTSIADWFHFVWDRTRSIRKDITQQELCSLGAVQLVEQCARFHIHCAARLVAEDPSVFDKKINAENLTKCLQTLKYMYHDLRIKGVPCPCEAEFRSYIVLLNLGDANFLWELKQLPAQIQNSQEIKRAIKFYNALQNNNYVRFFNMIRAKETSYLSACILLGYFNKLRLRAMEAIIKSHNWRKNAVFLPLSYLAKVLGFEDEQAAASFFTCHGLQCDGQRVMLERLKKPDLEYSMDRAMLLVESKRTTSVGECVCGHALETRDIFEQHQPHNSFDVNGLLKQEAWTADDQLRGEAAKRQQQQNKQEQRQISTATINATPPMIKTDSSIFKIPHASPPISPKQQQQQKLQQQQQQKPATFFGVQQFGENRGSPPQMLANFKFNADATFKIPLGNGVAKDKSNVAASYADSIFKPKPVKASAATSGSIFGNANAVSSNIFGTAAKETAKLFQQQQQQTSQQPEALRSDNVFQHFQTQTAPFENVASGGTTVEQTKSIFGLATNETPQQMQKQQPVEAAAAVDAAAKAKRIAELQAEQQRKEQELEEERRKLKAYEERQAQQHAAQRRRELVQRLQVAAERLTELEMNTLLTEQIAAIANAEYALHQAFNRRCEELLQALLDEVLSEQIEETAHEEYAVMCHDQMILNRYFERWLQHTRRKTEQRKLMECTPIWVTTDTRAEQTEKLLHPRQHENLGMIKRYRHGEPCDFKKLLWPGFGGEQRPLVDACGIIAKHAVRAEPTQAGLLRVRKYFKLLLTLPAEMEELPGYESLCNKWLRRYLKQKPVEETAPFICTEAHDVALCVRKISGVLPTNELGARVRDECHAADAVICFMSCVNMQNTRKRLHHLLKLCHIGKSVPLAIVVYNAQHDEQELRDALALDRLEEDGKISSYTFCGCYTSKSDFHFAVQLSSALRFVARESSFCNAEAEALEMQPLSCWLESNLGEEMWQRWHASALKNPAFYKICSIPLHVIGLYNEALCRLQEIIGADIQDAPDFPKELRKFVPKLQCALPCSLEYFPHDWKQPERQQKILQLLQEFQLPAVNEKLPHLLEDLEIWLLNYASRCLPQDDVAATEAGYQAITALIEQLNRADLQDLPLTQRIGSINYLPVVKALAFALANKVLRKESTQQLPNELIYRRQALLDYQTQPWWLNYSAITAVTVDYDATNTASADAETENAESAAQEGDDYALIMQQAEQISHQAEQHLEALKQQRLASYNSSDKQLTRALDESLYQYELAKQIGVYDVSHVESVTDEIDAALENTSNADAPQCKKRKYAAVEEDIAVDNEMSAIIARAFKLIEKVETTHDLHKQQNLRASDWPA